MTKKLTWQYVCAACNVLSTVLTRKLIPDLIVNSQSAVPTPSTRRLASHSIALSTHSK